MSAAVLSVTVTEAEGAGFVTAFPSGALRPDASNVNFVAGQTVPNQVVVPVGVDGRVQLYALATTHLLVDVMGYFTDDSAPASTAGLFVPQTPTRQLDTRSGGAPRPGPGADRFVPVPAQAAAVVLNVTAADAAAAGFVTAWPANVPQPNTSNLNLERTGQTIAGHVAVGAATGQVRLFTQNGTHLIADLAGWYTA
jgi:hypothetical protein